MYRNYRLKLSSDPSGFPLKVPSHPDFSSDSCYVTVTSAAHLCGTKVTRHENLLPLSAISASLTILVDAHRLPMNRVSVVTYAPVSVSPNPESFKKNGSKKLFQVSAPVIAAPARFPQHAALSKQFFGKNCRGRYKKIVGVGDPSIFRMARWSAPKMGGYYEGRKHESMNFTEPLINALATLGIYKIIFNYKSIDSAI
jgi:hypothetical protein